MKTKKPVKADKPSDTLRRAYREALLSSGYSPDVHVYDLDFYPGCDKGEKISFLKRIKAYYERLRGKEKDIFLCECLEKRRHYKYWYLEKYAKLDMKVALAELEERITRDFSC